MKTIARRAIRNERGQALVVTLLLLLIGSVIIAPTLNLMGTGVNTGRTYEQKIDKVYAADAGVEDALLHIKNDKLQALLGTNYDSYDFSASYPYPYVPSVNNRNVIVTIQNVWIPKDISTPSPSTARQIITNEKLLIVGYPSSTAATYVIKMSFNWATTSERDSLRVKTIGIWLSPGFEYSEYSGSCSLQGQSFYSPPSISPYKGGQAVVWTFSSQPLLRNFPGVVTGPPMVVTFTFRYTGPEPGQIPELVFSWVDTTGVSGVTYTWDDSIRLYKIESKADEVEIEAYGAKTKFRRLKGTISADYAIAGNTLMKATAVSGDDRFARDRLYMETTSNVTRIPFESIPPSGLVPPGKIPEEAMIDKVYLYWSGWIDPYYYYWKSTWPTGWTWATITDLRYSQRTKEQLIANSKINQVKFGVGSYAQTVTADRVQLKNTSDASGSSDSWAYSCFKDITNLNLTSGQTVREYIENAMKSTGTGSVIFTLGHADAVRNLRRSGTGSDYYWFALYNQDNSPTGQSTGYPLATPAHKKPDESSYQSRYQWTHAGWSLIIFYRSPAIAQRQLYLYDEFLYVGAGGSPDTETFTITGFLAPPVITENDKSHITYHVGEGDAHYYNCYIRVNGQALNSTGNPTNNVFNSYSNALPMTSTDGLDVDTFVLPTNCILPYDTSATVALITQRGYNNVAEIYTLVYMVLSFRSDLTTGSIVTNYAIKLF